MFTSKLHHWIVFAVGTIKAPVFVRSSEVLQPAAVVDETNVPNAEQTQPAPPSSDVDTKLQDFLKVGCFILYFLRLRHHDAFSYFQRFA